MKQLIAASLTLALAVPALALGDHETYDVGSEIDPKIAMPDIEGNRHKLGDLKDKTVVLDFWSMNCPWSIRAEPTLLALHEEYGKKDVVFLAVNSNKTEHNWDAEDPFAGIKEYVAENEITYPVLIDRDNVVADQFGGMTTPHVFVIHEGVIAYQGAIDDNIRGDKETTTPYLANALDEILAGKPVTTTKTKAFGCSIKRVAKRPTE